MLSRPPALPARRCLYTLPACLWACLLCVSTASAADANRLAYLDAFCDAYYPHVDFPKLVTPQWIGDPRVRAVVTLGIDDMKDSAPYETYLRPILQRLQQIDGRAPVSIMTNRIDPQDPRLQQWLREGLSLECHTADHPCPCLQGGDFAKAKSTFDRCVDNLSLIDHSQPVAFRFPCCDSQNTPSPRAFAEIFNKTSASGNFLQIDSSVVTLITPEDPDLPRHLVYGDDGQPRFGKYLPFPSFVNRVDNYPYPFVIAGKCWEFPIAVPDDWQGQNLLRPFNPEIVADMQIMIDATVQKQGVANVVFHPYGWLRNQQVVEVIEHAATKHGEKLLFLNFRECLERINQHLLLGHPLRSSTGAWNGSCILDLNNDGYLDVVIGNEQLQRTRLWSPATERWIEGSFPVPLANATTDTHLDLGVRFGVLQPGGEASLLVRNEHVAGMWHFDGQQWLPQPDGLRGLELAGQPIFTSRSGKDQGVRLRDLDQDGICELIWGTEQGSAVFRWAPQEARWHPLPFALPERTHIVNQDGSDAGLRFEDINEDGHVDVVFSNAEHYSVHLFADLQTGWSRHAVSGRAGDEGSLPSIASGGKNQGAWFARRHLWWQNEHTQRLPDGVARYAYLDLLRDVAPAPKSPNRSRQCIDVASGLRVELVAAEPLVMDPVAFDWGPDGKLWVVEMADYPLGLDDRGKPGGRVRFLEDSDADGRYDKSTLFLEGLSFPTGIMAWDNGVLVSAAPDIFFAADTDADGRADLRETLFTGFGEGNQQHRVNGFWRGLDNWIHIANGDSGGKIRSLKTGETVDISGRDLRIRVDTGELDAQSGQSQFGRTRDDWGNWFGCSNSRPLFQFVLADQYVRRNAYAGSVNPRRDICTLDNSPIYSIGRVLSHWEGYRDPAPGAAARFTSACGITIYRDDLLGQLYAGNAFVCEPVHNLVHRVPLNAEGISFQRAPVDPQHHEFLASSDPWFRPTMIRTGPDGALWISDMYRLVMEHPKWIDDQVEQQLELRAGHDRGRLYRIVPVGQAPRTVPRLDALATPQLVATLDSRSGWQRDLVQQLLVARKDLTAVKPLIQLTASSPDPVVRLQALCTLDGLGALTPERVLAALRDEHPEVRRHAVRLSEQFVDHVLLLPALAALVEDDHPTVRLQLACTLGQHTGSVAAASLARMAVENQHDPYVLAAVMSSLNANNIAAITVQVLEQEHRQSNPTFFDTFLPLVAELGGAAAVEDVIKHLTRPDRQPPLEAAVRMRAVAAVMRSGFRGSPAESARCWERLKPLLATARTIAVDPAADESTRVAAVSMLGAHVMHSSGELQILGPLISSQHAPAIQLAVIEALEASGRDEIPALLLQHWSTLSPQIRSRIVATLLTRTNWTRQLLAFVGKEEQGRVHFDPAREQTLLGHPDPQVREFAAALFRSTEEASRSETVAHYTAALEPGSPDQGRVLFRKHCAVCHRLEDVGYDIGPQLSALSNKSEEFLLAAILDPQRAIEDKYINYLVSTKDGRQFSGILETETGSTITLLGPAGQQTVVRRANIEQLTSSGKSLMPAGLEKLLDPPAMSDLLAYLAGPFSTPKTFPGNQPAVIEPAADGSWIATASRSEKRGPAEAFE